MHPHLWRLWKATLINYAIYTIFLAGNAKRKNKRASSLSSATDLTISTEELHRIIDTLKSNRLRDSTRQNYYCVWKQFNKLFLKLDHKPGTWEERITLYVGFLIDQGKHSQTVRSYVSAL